MPLKPYKQTRTRDKSEMNVKQIKRRYVERASWVWQEEEGLNRSGKIR